MADWSFVDLGSDETTWLALDYPMIVVQTVPVAPAYAMWVDQAQFTGAGDLTSWVDRSDTVCPARRAYDGYPGYVTKRGTGTNDDVWYYCFGFTTAVVFDCAFIVGHNLGTLDTGNDVLLLIADDDGFDTSLTTVGNFGTPTANDDSRLCDLSLSHGSDGGRTHNTSADTGPNRYTAQYVCLRINKTGTNITPEIGELILGRRYQMRCNPNNPWDRDALHDEVERTKTIGGITHTTIFSENQHILSAQFNAWETARIADFKSWFSAARGFFIWIAQPSTAPDSWRMITKQSDFEMPSVEYTERTIRITGEEQGPDKFYLENE